MAPARRNPSPTLRSRTTTSCDSQGQAGAPATRTRRNPSPTLHSRNRKVPRSCKGKQGRRRHEMAQDREGGTQAWAATPPTVNEPNSDKQNSPLCCRSGRPATLAPRDFVSPRHARWAGLTPRHRIIRTYIDRKNVVLPKGNGVGTALHRIFRPPYARRNPSPTLRLRNVWSLGCKGKQGRRWHETAQDREGGTHAWAAKPPTVNEPVMILRTFFYIDAGYRASGSPATPRTLATR